MTSYEVLKNRHQNEVNAFPFGFAFSNDQFEKMMAKWGFTPNDKDKIYCVCSGTFIRKEDATAMEEMFRRQKEERKKAIAEDATGDGYIYSMFKYELANHEYGYTHELDDTLDALGLTLEKVKADKRLRHGLNKALKRYYDFNYEI